MCFNTQKRKIAHTHNIQQWTEEILLKNMLYSHRVGDFGFRSSVSLIYFPYISHCNYSVCVQNELIVPILKLVKSAVPLIRLKRN